VAERHRNLREVANGCELKTRVMKRYLDGCVVVVIVALAGLAGCTVAEEQQGNRHDLKLVFPSPLMS
jgi:hypothetical protein